MSAWWESVVEGYKASESGVVRAIRLTDDGEFVDRCELTDAIYEIRNCQESELIVWYIHGWKHNADEEDSDRRGFESLIRKLAKKQSGEADRRRVVGIYIGWMERLDLPSSGICPSGTGSVPLTESANHQFLPRSLLRRSTLESRGGKITARDLTIMIGHSFGARILYTATSQVLIDEVQRGIPARCSLPME